MSEEQSQSRSGLPPRRSSGLPSRRDIIRARQEAAAAQRQTHEDRQPRSDRDTHSSQAQPKQTSLSQNASAQQAVRPATNPSGAADANSQAEATTQWHPRPDAARPASSQPARSSQTRADAANQKATSVEGHSRGNSGKNVPGLPAAAAGTSSAARSSATSSANGRHAQPGAATTTGTHQPVVEDPLTNGVRSRRIEKERKRQHRRRRNAKIRSTLVLLLAVALIAGCGYVAYSLLTKDSSPLESGDYPGPGTGSVEFVINPGDSGAVIGANLVEAGVVKTQEAFLTAWNDNANAASIQPGTYELKTKMRAVDAVAALLDETRRSSNAVSVVPGASVKDVGERMKAFAKFKAEDVDAALSDTAAIGLPAEAKGSLEGWLAPGTYEIHTNDKPAEVVQRMVENTVQTLESLNVPRDQWHTVLTKASILDMEVNIDRYLPQVARVIENRLDNPAGETAGFLNMDSTVNYGVGRSGGIPSSEDLQKDTPYNTYLHKGLPPTPIASPSKAAIEATLNPAPGDWLYFVTVDLDSGETKFAATKAEHDANIALLTQWCEEHKGKC